MTPRHALNVLLTSESFLELEARLRRVSAFHILKIETWEISHARLLAWLLDPRASHGMGAEPLRRFVLLAAREDPNEATLDAVDLDQLDLASALVEVERSVEIPDKRSRRLDVLVLAQVPDRDEPAPILVVEYKVDAEEGEEQTADYAAWARTQPLTLAGRTVLPLQVYLCPVVREDHAPAPPFVTVGYEDYLGWVDGLGALEKTEQAKFLVEEWKACLRARNDVADEDVELLLADIREAHGPEVEVLRKAPKEALEPLRHVLDQHDEVFTQLGVQLSRRGRGSKGHSATISLAREVLEAAVDDARWTITGAGGSLRGVFLPSVEAVATWAKEKPRTSKLCCQLFADRPSKGRLRLALEVVHDLPGVKDKEEARRIRQDVAASLREVLKGVDERLDLGPKATIARFTVKVPKVKDVESDMDENVAEHRAALEAVAARVVALEDALASWWATELPPLLDAVRVALD